MHHATDGAAVTSAELREGLKVLWPEIELELDAEFEVRQRFAAGATLATDGQVMQMGTSTRRGIPVGGLVQGQVLEVSLFTDGSWGDHDRCQSGGVRAEGVRGVGYGRSNWVSEGR